MNKMKKQYWATDAETLKEKNEIKQPLK